MATPSSHEEAPAPGCKCDAVSLMKLAINLIDPPMYSIGNIEENAADRCVDGGSNDAGKSDSQMQLSVSASADNIPSMQNDNTDEIDAQRISMKRVRFNETSCDKRKNISVHDVMKAYDLLIHATCVQPVVDLLDEYSFINTSWDTFQQYADTFRALLVVSCLLLEMLPRETLGEMDTNAQWMNDGRTCPILDPNPQTMEYLSENITKKLFHTSRRCIVFLQYLEKQCAAKTISQRHNTSTFYSGGDDIEDYERSSSDLHENYDWHDDGFLPAPGSYNHPTGASILHECCCRPLSLSVQPSSRYEKSASTKEWARGERLISMNVEDYEYDKTEHLDVSEVGNNSSPVTERNGSLDVPNQNDNFSPDIISDEENPFFTLSPTALAEEEVNLLDVMIPIEQSAPDKPTKQKNKKRKFKRSKVQIKQSISEHNQTQDSMLDRKEGFLLLRHNNQASSLSKRVYARLHPSGWLSIEDRSIPFMGEAKNGGHNNLSHRTRYWDYFVTRSTICKPWMHEGVVTFHLCLDGILLLGSSAVNHCTIESNGIGQKVDLLFGVDEMTGGALVDGFEWVSAISTLISSSKQLYETLCSE